MIKKKKYNYLICYGFTQKIPSGIEEHPYYTQSSTGRVLMELPYKIKTFIDILGVETKLMNNLKETEHIENVDRVCLYSFNELEE